MKRRRTNVAVIVATVLVAVTTIVLATVAVTSHLSERRRELDRLRRDLVTEAEHLADSLALPVWNIDRVQIDKIVDGLDPMMNVQAIVVHAAGRTHARIRNSRWQLVPWDGRTHPAGLLAQERPITFEGERIGTVRVLVTQRFLDQRLRASLVSMIGTTALVDLLLSLSVYAILWRSVLRPLRAVEQYAQAVSATGGESVEMPAEAGAASELLSLRSSIHSMVQSLAQRYSALQRESQARVESEERFHTVFDSVHDAIVIRDVDTGEVVDVNRATFAMFGYSPEERSALDVANLTSGAGEFTEEAAVQKFRAAAGGEPQVFEWQSKRKDGQLLWTEISVYAAMIRGKKRAISVVRDITQRRHAEAEQLRLRDELAQSAMEWRQTFDTVLTPILITDRDGTVRRVNRAALEACGLSEIQLLGLRVDEIGSGEPWSTAAQLVASISADESVATAKTRDGEARTWDLSIAHFSTPREGADRFIIVFWEITGIVDLQESLRRSETLSAMGTLVAGVAHEVRNPLFGISATLDAYEAELSRPGYEDLKVTLRREVGRLTSLMQELLEYGKPSDFTLERGSVPEVIQAAVENRLPAARTAGVALANLTATGDATLLIDRSRLQQVFENVIDNAIQHSRRGGNVRIRSQPVERAGRCWIEFLVEDEGPGFPPRDLQHVFEPFFTGRPGGTGLGLSIVQRIVEEHSGKVTAANRPDGGAVVAILLPVADAQVRGKGVA
jgi:PAS domain S-box-containing protein